MTAEANLPPSWLGDLRRLIQEEIAAFAGSGFLRNASISGGAGLTIADGGKFRAEYPKDVATSGQPLFYLGRIVDAVTGEYLGTGMLLQAPDGTDMMTVRTDAKFGTTMHNVCDSGGRIIVSNDAATGQGLARPYVPAGFYRQRYADWSVQTTAGAWEGLWKGEIVKQHPRLSVAVQVSTTASDTTGEVRVLVDGAQLGAVQSVGFALAVKLIGPAAVAGDHMKVLTVEIQGQRTAGTGGLKVEPLHLLGVQS
jgi:hypothetical protein